MFFVKKILAEIKLYNFLRNEYLKLDTQDKGYVLFSKNQFENWPYYKKKTVCEIIKDANLARIIIEEWRREGIVEELKMPFRPSSDFFRLTPKGFSLPNHPIIKRFLHFLEFITSLIFRK